jgi:hypothetical protein
MSDAVAILELILVSGAVLALPTSIMLLGLFRRSVQKAMFASKEEASTAPVDQTISGESGTCGASTPLAISTINDGGAQGSANGNGWEASEASRAIYRVVLIYSLAGLAFALVFSVAWLVQPEAGLTFGRMFWLVAVFWWPSVLAIELIASSSWRESLTLALPYFAFVVASGGYELAASTKLTIGQLVASWFLVNGLPTLLLFTFLRRRVRAVGPLILTITVIGLAGAWFAGQFLVDSTTLFDLVLRVSEASTLSVSAVLWLGRAVAFLVLAVLGWWLLRQFGELHRRKQISDQSLTLDTVFALFAIVGCFYIPTKYIWGGPAAFFAYKLIAWMNVKHFVIRHQSWRRAPVLLLLRVFSLGKRSEALFDALTKRWRRVGGIALIAGPDLIRNTVQPDEFLDFLGGRISRRFVSGVEDLEKRVSTLDRMPDPDGRYRVNQFFCRSDSWRIAVRRLVKETSVVLMDLRSFSAENQGCIYELGQILNYVDLRRTLFVVDFTTNRQFLEETLRGLWNTLSYDSPNHAAVAPCVRLFLMRTHSGSEVRSLLRALWTVQLANSISE